MLGLGWTTKSNRRLSRSLFIDTQTYSFVQLYSSGHEQKRRQKDSYPEVLETEIAIHRGTRGR